MTMTQSFQLTSRHSSKGKSLRTFTTEPTYSSASSSSSSSSSSLLQYGLDDTKETFQEPRRVKTKSPYRADFRAHLRSISKNTKNPKVRAMTMDAELTVMERRWAKNTTATNEIPERTDDSVWRYAGPVVKPDVNCYAIVADAYAKAGTGVQGAQCVEQILERAGGNKNRVLMSAVVKAWALADQWTKANQCLDQMKANAELNPEYGPDVVTYTTYIDALSKSKKKSNTDIQNEALYLLDQMKNMKGHQQMAKPNSYTVAAVLKCVARSKDMETMEALLKEWTRQYQESNKKDASSKPSVRDYGAVMDAWAKSGQGLTAAVRAHDLLQELCNLYYTTKDVDFLPNEYLFTSVLSAYSRVDTKDITVALRRTDELLDVFEREFQNYDAPHVYSAAMQLKIKEANPNGAIDAEDLLRRMPSPDRIAYQIVILSYASRDQPCQAERLLDEYYLIVKEQKRWKEMTNPVTVAACVNSWLRSNDDSKVLHADGLVKRLASMYKEGYVNPNERHIDQWIFNAVISAWTESQKECAGENAEALLNIMWNDFRGTIVERPVAPSNETYALALDAWAASGHVNSGTRAMILFRELEAKHESDPTRFPKPNSRALFPTLVAVVKSGEDGMISLANELFSRLCQLRSEGDDSFDLNTRTTTSLLREFSKNPSADAGLRAESLLQYVVDLSSSSDDLFDLRPGTIEYNCVINIHAKKGSIQNAENLLVSMKAMTASGNENVKPDRRTYSSMLEGLTYLNRKDSLVRAETLFNEMLRLYMNGDDSLKPDSVIFNNMFNLLAVVGIKPGPLVEKGFELLATMKRLDLVPSNMIYAIICRLCLNDGSENSMELVKNMVDEAEALVQSGKSPPLERSVYEQALTTYMYSKAMGSKQKAKELFEHMENLIKTGQVNFELDRSTIHLLLAAWGRSGDAISVKESMIMLEKLKERRDNEKMKPTISSYNWVLLATSVAEAQSITERQEHFRFAIDIFKEVHKQPSFVPNHLTYDTFLKASWKLLPEEGREGIMVKSFELCVKNGCVSNSVIATLVQKSPNVLNGALAQVGLSPTSELPTEWYRNVPVSKRFRVAD